MTASQNYLSPAYIHCIFQTISLDNSCYYAKTESNNCFIRHIHMTSCHYNCKKENTKESFHYNLIHLLFEIWFSKMRFETCFTQGKLLF